MQNPSKNIMGTSRKGGWNALIMGVCVLLIILILWSLRVFIGSVQEMSAMTNAVESEALPTYPTLTIHKTITPYKYPTEVLVTVVLHNIQPPNIQQSCVITAGRYVCTSYLVSDSTSAPPTFTPSITPSPTSTSTPTPTATATPTFTPTNTSTPTPTVLELPQTRAGLSLLSTICLTGLLIGILIPIAVRRSKP